jgi:pseudouridine-5'-phosphate glycosidase
MMFKLGSEVAAALAKNQPVVALESTVIAHGLPRPQNLELGLELERIVRAAGATPATIAVVKGVPHIGLNSENLEFLAHSENFAKISRRDLPFVLANKSNGATTVATAAFFAHRAGIKILATGGIGGVHRGALPDISADLPELAQTPTTVVCAGAKAILDLTATREWLETWGVCVVGWQTDDFPAFYSRRSKSKVDVRVENAAAAAQIIKARDRLNLPNAVLLAVPVPPEAEILPEKIENYLAAALREARDTEIFGKNLTPFLLRRLAELSDGATLRANIALLKQNARVAAEIAQALI